MECLCLSVRPLVSPRRKVWITYIQAYMPHESSEDSSNQPDGPIGSHRCPPWPLNDDTKNLTETDTETFFTIPKFLKPKPTLFSETNYSKTITNTSFLKPIFPNPRLFPRPNLPKFPEYSSSSGQK